MLAFVCADNFACLFIGVGVLNMRFQQATNLSDRQTAPESTSDPIEPIASLMFIDSRISDYQSLLQAVQPQTEIHILDPHQDAIAQITQALQGRQNISSLHLVSHGKAGAIQLGRDWLTESTLQDHAAQLQQWSQLLTADADILIYGCHVAEGELGQAFVDRFSQLTGLDIAASTNLTGSSDLGGDWILEAATGEITSALAFESAAIDRYSGILPSSNVVISQIYGGGGNAGTTFRNDFIELFNTSATAVDLSGWSVQYAPATSTTWQVTPLSGSIAPFSYYLIQQGSGSNGSINLPTPDAIGSIMLSATSGKVALVSNSTALSGANPTNASVIDRVGYGTANGFETSAAPALSNTTAAKRTENRDTDSNAADFTTGTPTPRNSSSPPEVPTLSIAAGSSPIESFTNGTFTLSLSRAASTDLTINFSIAGSADRNRDYTIIGGTGIRSVADGAFVIAAGTTAATLTIQPIDDLAAEADETIQLTLTNGTGYAIGTSTDRLTIAANDFVVTNTNDTGEGSLRQAILNANAIAGADTITFAGVFTDSDISNDAIAINSTLELTETANLIGTPTLQAVDRFAIFRISAGVDVAFDRFTFRNGSSAIDNAGTIRISNSTFHNNEIGIANTGTIANLSNSTLSSNGTGIANAGTIANFVNNTIAASTNAGIANTGTIASLFNNLLVSNASNAIAGSITNQSNNLAGTFASVGLSPLGSYGGSTQTHALLPGSAAIDAGISGVPTQDQRGVARVGAVDIGAFESRGFTLEFVSGSNQTTRTETNFANPIALSIRSGFDEPVNGGAVTFTSPTTGASTNPVSQTIAISEGQAIASITANATGGTYTVTATTAGNQGSAVRFSLTNLAPNVAPILAFADAALDYTENDPATPIDAIATVRDSDSANFEGGTLTIDYSTGGTADDRLTVRAAESISISGNEVRWNDTAIASFTGSDGTAPLIFQFNANATPTAVSALLQNLTYANVSEDPNTASRILQLVLTDGDGGSTVATKTINVTAINDAPVLVNNRFSVIEGKSLMLTEANLSAIDAENTAVRFSVSSVTNGQFELISSPGIAVTDFTQAQATNRQIRFVHNGSEAAPTFNLSISDGTNSTPPVAAIIAYTPVNDAPTVATPIADQSAIVGRPSTFTLPIDTFADADLGDRLTFRATLANGNPLPTWLSFDADRKTFRATPTTEHVGSIEIQVTATDTTNAAAIDVFRFVVQPQPDQPTLNPAKPMGTPIPAIAFERPNRKTTGTIDRDRLKGSWFNDVLNGGAGNDVLSSGYGKARLGQDKLNGGAGNDRLYSGAGRDRLAGGSGRDRLYAGKGRDLLLGGAGNDWLSGNQGDDILVGGQGHDTLIGGGGKDMFVFQAIADATDLIQKFEAGEDVIDLRSIFKQPQFRSTSSFEQYQNFVRLVQVGNHTDIQIDADGSSAETQFVTLARLESISISTIDSTHFVI
ncbi:DUF4347 domain-containing protein [Microcoleus sp. FACHB-1515]|uniref:DUF4347 domain-containing protein n=1 Tax=Cyanophyceae TaxID=3028117 RepID=UPI0016841BC2|nr:DUF4347 domain-containing protein [Microcoleus sp. FACHB-1515]MBD2089976.1 DUF4347 domain-containing protein [Microcoleus sp. FACHB-1515]